MDDIPSPSSDLSSSDLSQEKACAPLRVVGIGAGAGGLEAVQLFFGAMPASTGLAFIICRFVELGLADPLAEFLRTQTDLPVIHAEDGIAVEADHIYLIAPSARMILLNQRLVSFDRDEEAKTVSPIDLLFHSLGASAGSSAIAVILSGHGADGVRGAASVREFGGMVFAQHPESTDYATMPRRVIEADLATDVASPGAMPGLIRRRIDGADGPETSQDEPPLDDQALAYIAALLKARFGFDSRVYRSSLVRKRVRRRFDRSGSSSFKAYADRLVHDEAELVRLHDDLMIGVTAFFRDPEAFMVLEKKVVPALVEGMSPERPIRVWVPGCATGEEAYSLAMVILDQIERAGKEPLLEVIASDRHERALKCARYGRYRRDRLGSAPSDLIARYLDDRGDDLEIGSLLRRHVTFVEHDLLQAEPPDDIDLVSCRNLIIYLAEPSRKDALAACCDALKSDGFLFLGPSEQPGGLCDGFASVDSKWRIYNKTTAPLTDGPFTATPFTNEDTTEKLTLAKSCYPAETIIPKETEALPAAPDLSPEDFDHRGDFEGMMSGNQHILESTIDTLLASNDALRRRNRDLRQENQRLAAAHAALDDVATMIAHDLKAPLHSAERLFVQLKQTTSTSLGPEEAARSFRPMQLQLLALDRLIDDLLIYARQGQPKRGDFECVDMAELLQEMLTLIGLPDGIKVMMQPSTLEVSTWRTPLACILRNLLVRSIHNLNDGVGTIRIDIAADDKMLEVTIADDSSSFSNDQDSLGLAIIQQLLDAAGGRLTLTGRAMDQAHQARFTWPIATETSETFDEPPSEP